MSLNELRKALQREGKPTLDSNIKSTLFDMSSLDLVEFNDPAYRLTPRGERWADGLLSGDQERKGTKDPRQAIDPFREDFESWYTVFLVRRVIQLPSGRSPWEQLVCGKSLVDHGLEWTPRWEDLVKRRNEILQEELAPFVPPVTQAKINALWTLYMLERKHGRKRRGFTWREALRTSLYDPYRGGSFTRDCSELTRNEGLVETFSRAVEDYGRRVTGYRLSQKGLGLFRRKDEEYLRVLRQTMVG